MDIGDSVNGSVREHVWFSVKNTMDSLLRVSVEYSVDDLVYNAIRTQLNLRILVSFRLWN